MEQVEVEHEDRVGQVQEEQVEGLVEEPQHQQVEKHQQEGLDVEVPP